MHDNYPDKPLKPKQLTSEALAEQVEKFLAQGGEINEVDSTANRGQIPHKAHHHAKANARNR